MAASNHSFSGILPFPAANWPFRAERRQKLRYPLDLGVRFRSSSREGFTFFGVGMAVNLSSGGILVASQQQVVEGASVEMSIEWPFLLDGRIPLQLITAGRVLRRGTSRFAATFERHEFRTMRISSSSSDEDPLLSGRTPPTPTP